MTGRSAELFMHELSIKVPHGCRALLHVMQLHKKKYLHLLISRIEWVKPQDRKLAIIKGILKNALIQYLKLKFSFQYFIGPVLFSVTTLIRVDIESSKITLSIYQKCTSMDKW